MDPEYIFKYLFFLPDKIMTRKCLCLPEILARLLDLNLVSGLFPGENYPGRSFYGGEFLAINAASKNSAAADLFVKFLTSPENQIRFCRANRSANPSSRQAQGDAYFANNIHLQTFIKQIALANHPPVVPEWVGIEAAIEDDNEPALRILLRQWIPDNQFHLRPTLTLQTQA